MSEESSYKIGPKLKDFFLLFFLSSTFSFIYRTPPPSFCSSDQWCVGRWRGEGEMALSFPYFKSARALIRIDIRYLRYLMLYCICLKLRKSGSKNDLLQWFKKQSQLLHFEITTSVQWSTLKWTYKRTNQDKERKVSVKLEPRLTICPLNELYTWLWMIVVGKQSRNMRIDIFMSRIFLIFFGQKLYP